MIKALTLILALTTVSVQAAPMLDEGNPYPYSDDANQPAQAMQMTEAADNEVVNCWGWDGSKGGNDVRKMARGECFNMHGTVDNPRVRARNNAIKKDL